MYIKLCKLQEKVILILNSNNESNIDEIAKILKMYPSELKRVIERMQKKKIVSLKKNTILVLNEQENKIENNLSKNSNLKQVYNHIRKSNLFDNKLDYILIQSDVFFINIFNNSIDDNESLNQVREINKKQFHKIIEGLRESLTGQVNDLKTKVMAWSENRYKIIFDSNKIKLIDNKFNICARIEDFKDFGIYKKRQDFQLLSEIILLLEKSIKELNEFTKIIADHDYLNH